MGPAPKESSSAATWRLTEKDLGPQVGFCCQAISLCPRPQDMKTRSRVAISDH